MRVINVSVEDELWEKARKYAEDNNLSISQLTEELLKMFLD